MIHADNDGANDDGTVTVQSTKTVTANNSEITITAFDIDLAGHMTAGTQGIYIRGSKATQTIGLGGSPSPAPSPAVGNMWFSDAEFSRTTGNGRPTVGSSFSGEMYVYGVTKTSVDSIGTVTLISTKAGLSFQR